MREEEIAVTCSNRRRGSSGAASGGERTPVKRYVHPICRPPSSGSCQMLEAILGALERQNALLEALCRSLGGQSGDNL